MTYFDTRAKSSRKILMLTAGIVALVAAQGALAKDGGGGNHAGTGSHGSGAGSGAHERMASRDSDHDRSHGNEYKDPEKRSEKREHERAERGEHCESKTCRTTNYPPAPGTGGTNTIHPIINLHPGGTTSGKPVPVKLPPQPITENYRKSSTGIINTIHPIINTGTGAAANNPARGIVTVSNGVTRLQVREGADGLLVKQDGGNITVSSSGQSVTLPGGSVTVSGAISAGAAAGIQVARQPNGDMTFAANPVAPPPVAAPPQVPGHVTGGPDGGFFGDLGSSIADGFAGIGKGIGSVVDPGFTAGPVQPASPSATAKVQQP